MGKIFLVYLTGSRIFACADCGSHLSKPEDIISKNFNGAHGKAYLFDKVVNVLCGAPEERVLSTGVHSVMDIYCNNCMTVLGWKYKTAHETSQKYKEGKFILEKKLIVEIPAD
eukprot:Sdes_comp12900_c0_seq1m3026